MAVRLDLAARAAKADVHRGPLAGDLCGDGAEARLSASWGARSEEGVRWTRGPEGVIEIPVVTPREMRVRALLAPTPEEADERAPQRVRLLWNGRALGSPPFELGGPPLDLRIPAGWQRVGPNLLELRSVVEAEDGGPTPDPGARAIGCRSLSLVREGARGDAAGAGLVARGGALVQLADSVVTFGLAAPDDARLVGKVRLLGGRGGAHLTLALLDERGGDRVLAETQLGAGAGRSAQLDLPLGDASGGLAALSLAFASAGGATGPAARLEWRGLRVVGTAPAPRPLEGAIPRAHYNVLVLLFDSLRADQTEPYGAREVKTPAMARLAAEGVTFLEARSSASWTRPAAASLLTSLPPAVHGIEHIGQRLPARVPYLPQILRERGYRTVAVSNNPMVARQFGFERGFEALHELFKETREADAPLHATPEEQARALWDRFVEPMLADGRPFFAYVHELDPHSPYEPQPPYDALYDFGYRGSIDSSLGTFTRIRDDASWVEPADIRQLEALYRGEISYMDRYLGWLLGRLDARGLADRTLVVLLSDHGEEFLDHRSIGHGHTLYEELLRVPLILRLPGVLPAGRRVRAGAQLIDLPPSVLDLLGEPIPPAMRGASLLPVLEGAGLDLERPAFATSRVPPRSSVRRGRWKLIRDHARGGAPDGYRLFDLEADPGERRDAWAREVAVGRALRQLLASHLAQRRRPVRGPLRREELEPEVAEGLKALGYIE